jgi:hypothetical protein
MRQSTGQTRSAAEAGDRLRAVLGTLSSRLLNWAGRYHLGQDVTGGRPSQSIGALAALTAAGYCRLADVPAAELKAAWRRPKAVRLLREALERHGMSLGYGQLSCRCGTCHDR